MIAVTGATGNIGRVLVDTLTTAGQDVRKIAMNYLLLVPQAAAPVVQVESAATVNGPYTVDTTASSSGANSFSVPLTAGNRFFRLRANSGNPQIGAIRVAGGAVIFDWTILN